MSDVLTDTVGSAHNVRAVMRTLSDYAPFNQMDAQHLAYLVENSSLAFYPAEKLIIGPEHGKAAFFYIVYQGHVRGERPDGQGDVTSTTFEISTGECFPIAALLGERQTRTHHLAAVDTFCLQVPAAAFVELFADSSEFRDYCLRGVSSLLEKVGQRIQTAATENLGAAYSLNTPLAEIALRNPIVCTPDTPLMKAVKLMHDANVGSVIMTNETRQPIGIFTLRDLRRLIANGDYDAEAPIANFMSSNPVALTPNATAFEAAILMARHRFAHLCLVDDEERLVGVVSERDLFALQRVDLVHMAKAMAGAPTVDALRAMRPEINRLVDSLLSLGAAAPQISRIITLLNDCTVERVIELTLRDAGVDDIPFTWLVFGSEARREQTLHTDQDNGILFQVPSGETEDGVRARLLPVAHRINTALDAIGFTWCKGNVMASNPKLCLSGREWEAWYRRWIDTPTPQNLLNSAIYLDIRPVRGDHRPVEAVIDVVHEHIRSNTLFQRMLAENALRQRPPLNIFRGFVYASDEKGKKIDLKVQGLTPFTDAARLYAYANDIRQTNTVDRLEALAEAGLMDARDASAWLEAYGVIQLLRMKHHQDQMQRNEAPSNRIDPNQLNPLDRRILREAFRQAQRLQQKIEVNYQL